MNACSLPLLAVLSLFGPGVAAAQNAASATAQAAAVQPAALDRLVLAIVDGEELNRAQLVTRLLDYHGETARDRMINRALLVQGAKLAGVTVTDEELEKRFAEIRGQFKKDDDFRALLTQSRLSEKLYREELRSTMLLQKVALKETPVADTDLQQFEIRICLAGDRPTAEKWIKTLETGGDFARLAATENTDPSLKQTGGRMRPFMAIEMLDVARAITDQKLRPGGFTRMPVLLTDRTWAVIKLEGLVPATAASAAERDRLVALLTRFRMDQWINRVREKATVREHPLDQPVVATVNGEAINRNELVSRVLEFQGEEALELMINRVLLLQEAKRQGVTVTETEADQFLADARKGFRTPDEFQAFLTRGNLSERQFRDELRYQTLMERVALKESPVGDDDLRRFDIRMLVTPDRATADKWAKELADGADFEKMVRERSADPQGREAGGRMRPFIKIELLDVWRALEEQKVKPGGFTRTPVLLTDGSWVLLKLQGILAASTLTAEERTKLLATVKSYRVSMWLNQTLNQARDRNKISRPVPLSAALIRG